MTNLDGKLRRQAARLGLKPGSPEWVRYVLGTQAKEKAKRRKRFAFSSPKGG